jgi:hypothetical protein
MENTCTDEISLVIPKCFEIKNNESVQVFQLGPLIGDFVYEYANMTNGATGGTATELNGNVVLKFDVSGPEQTHDLCLDTLRIPVVPLCITKKLFSGCIGQIECTVATVI